MLSLLFLRFVLASGVGGDSQVTEEIRWGLSAVGAMVVLIAGSFLVQLAAAPVRLQERAVSNAVLLDRTLRRGIRRRVLERRLYEGTRLRQRIDSQRGRWSSPALAEITRAIRLWQRKTERSVMRCAPEHFVDWRAAAGNLVPEFGQPGWQRGWQNEMDARLSQWMRAIAALDGDD